MLKEARKLVLCVRDTPFSRIHLENMLRAQQAGAVIMPAIPSFYHHPKTIDDLVVQYVCRVLAQMELPHDAMFRLDRLSHRERSQGLSATPMSNRMRTVLEMIKFEHSVFALPFALTGALLGSPLHLARLAFLAATAVDCHRHGGGAQRSYDHQPYR